MNYCISKLNNLWQRRRPAEFEFNINNSTVLRTQRCSADLPFGFLCLFLLLRSIDLRVMYTVGTEGWCSVNKKHKNHCCVHLMNNELEYLFIMCFWFIVSAIRPFSLLVFAISMLYCVLQHVGTLNVLLRCSHAVQFSASYCIPEHAKPFIQSWREGRRNRNKKTIHKCVRPNTNWQCSVRNVCEIEHHIDRNAAHQLFACM